MGSIFDTALVGLFWLFVLAVIIGFFKSPYFKGWLGESAAGLSAKLFLPKDQYTTLHNVTLPTADGTTQIDHVIVSRFGVFVVETKNYKGWIFGSEHQPTWTQKIYRRTHKFQNPLRQNYKHLKTLESALGISPEVLHSVVVFMGECRFKTPMPPNVCIGGAYTRYIKSKTTNRHSLARLRRGT
jgi:restriction system protein